jgi:hypothetical protein
MSRDLGIEFAVTPWTMDELRTSIARSRRDIEGQKAFIRPELVVSRPGFHGRSKSPSNPGWLNLSSASVG